MIIAVVGMCGAGKSIVAETLAEKGMGYVRLGQITMDILKEKGLPPSEEHEKPLREQLRKEHGMAAYAILNIPKIDKLAQDGHVVVDGLYSWEEYIEFKKKYGENLLTLCVFASPKTRHNRLAGRTFDAQKDKDMKFRPLTEEQAKARDKSEIENLNKGGPISMADYTIINEGSIEKLKKDTIDFFNYFNQ